MTSNVSRVRGFFFSDRISKRVHGCVYTSSYQCCTQCKKKKHRIPLFWLDKNNFPAVRLSWSDEWKTSPVAGNLDILVLLQQKSRTREENELLTQWNPRSYFVFYAVLYISIWMSVETIKLTPSSTRCLREIITNCSARRVECKHTLLSRRQQKTIHLKMFRIYVYL